MLGILEGLDEEALRRPLLPSGWTCLGLVRRLPSNIERCRFRAVVPGEQTVIDDLATTPDDAWRVGPDVPVAAVVTAYRREMALANAIVAATPLDTAPD